MIAPSAILGIARKSLRANKMRSLLTALGIIIGVAAVVAMFAIGTGANKKVTEQISSMGSNLLIVRSGSTTSGGQRMGMGSTPTLTFADAEAIQKECPSVLRADPSDSSTVQIVYGNLNWSTRSEGTNGGLLEIQEWPLSSGRNFTDSDVRRSAKVCILGQTVVANLFGGEDPIGKTIRVKKVPVTVVGVLKKKGNNAMGQDQDDTLLLPITTAQKRIYGSKFQGRVRMIRVKAASEAEISAAS